VPSVVQLLLLFPRVFCWVDGAHTPGCGSLVGDLSGHWVDDKARLLLETLTCKKGNVIAATAELFALTDWHAHADIASRRTYGHAVVLVFETYAFLDRKVDESGCAAEGGECEQRCAAGQVWSRNPRSSLAYLRCATRTEMNTVQTCRKCRLCAIYEHARGVSSACASQTNDCGELINESVAEMEEQSLTEMHSRAGKRT